MEKVSKINTKQSIEKNEESEKIKIIAKQLLKEIGIKTHILGFKYWITALLLVIENEENAGNEKVVMMQLYYYVAKKHKTTANKVERAMRYAYSELNLNRKFNVDYSINNTVLLFLLKEEILNRMYNTPKT